MRESLEFHIIWSGEPAATVSNQWNLTIPEDVRGYWGKGFTLVKNGLSYTALYLPVLDEELLYRLLVENHLLLGREIVPPLSFQVYSDSAPAKSWMEERRSQP